MHHEPMDEKSGSELIRRNEQVKAVSSLMGNAGLALVAAALGRWFLEGVDDALATGRGGAYMDGCDGAHDAGG
jgi:hypothetical protein